MAQVEEQPAGFTPSDGLGHIERLRTRAALAMVIASVAVGFMAGRASVWLVPFDTPAAGGGRMAAVSARETPSRAETRRTEQPPQDKPSAPPAPQATAAQPAQPSVESASTSPPPPAPATDAPRSPPTPDATPARPGVTLINPGSAEARPNPSDPSRPSRESAGKSADSSPAGTEECERRFSSFRPSDGTYQPFGGGARARCPLLR
jgi:hypothetical protein